MEERTQIKFNNPDIDGTPQPQLITLEQETPIEGQSERDNGESFVWHKWLCTSDQYFMASDSLDAMLKSIPSKTGKPLKIEKVENPKGPYPYFQINGLDKDGIAEKVASQSPSIDLINPVMPSQATTVPASNSNGALTRLEQKLDQVIQMVSDILVANKETQTASQDEEFPF